MAAAAAQYYFRFSTWWCRSLWKPWKGNIYPETKFNRHTLIRGWDITTSVLEKQPFAILEFYLWFQFWPYHHIGHRHVTLHRLPNFVQIGPSSADIWCYIDFQDGVRCGEILLPVSISTISPQSACHSEPVWQISSKLNRTPTAEKMTSCRFARWLLDFRGTIMGSLKSPCTTYYRSSLETIALNCLVFVKIAFRVRILEQTDKRTDRRRDRQTKRTAPTH